MSNNQPSPKKQVRCLPDYQNDNSFSKAKWPSENTAIMVVHGIGHQQPIETLDQFSRGLIKQYQRLFPGAVTFEHRLALSGEGTFQNIIRLRHKEHRGIHIDLYEYYWAYCTQDKADLSDINVWLQGVVKGAKKYYARNKDIIEKHGDDSIFFKNGKFLHTRYDLLLNFVTKSCLFLNFLITGLLKLVGFIPFIGDLAKNLLKSYFDSSIYKLSNLVGDIVIYNVTDEKSKFYPVRKQILQGATDLLKYIIEKEENNKLAYPSVYVAGHSLGSEIAYDAINRINLLANAQQLKFYNSSGIYNDSSGLINPPPTLAQQLKGLITYGSPLDKIAFFLRQIVDDKQFIWEQVITNYHCFKQGMWNRTFNEEERLANLSVKRLLDDIVWINYYDDDDIISGRLDYYERLTNVNCKFNCNKQFTGKKSRFTHSHYWDCHDFFEDLIREVLIPDAKSSGTTPMEKFEVAG